MHVKLFLTTTSLHNVVISNSSDVIYYEIVTPRWERHHTRISRLDPNTRAFSLIGELQNGGDKATPIAYRLYGSTFRPTSEFLMPEERSKVESHRKGKGKEKEKYCPASDASFRGKDGRKYTWRIREKELELFRDDLPEDRPVAVYHREKRHLYVLRMSQHPFLEIDTEALDTLDTLILSFLLVERRRRDGTV